jgi:hypothetical protein
LIKEETNQSSDENSREARCYLWQIRHTSPDRIRSGFAMKPTHDEQDLIVLKIDGIDAALASMAKESAKLGSVKFGLQDDLLTGRIRVPESIMEGTAAV